MLFKYSRNSFGIIFTRSKDVQNTSFPMPFMVAKASAIALAPGICFHVPNPRINSRNIFLAVPASFTGVRGGPAAGEAIPTPLTLFLKLLLLLLLLLLFVLLLPLFSFEVAFQRSSSSSSRFSKGL